MKRWLKSWLVLSCLVWATSLHAANTQVRLLLSLQAAKPGETVMAGIQLKMNPTWHTYWVNAGDSGMPTKIEWQLPEGITAGEIAWPVPEKDVASGLTTFIYRNEVWLRVPLKIAANTVSGTKEIKAKLSWLECAEVCVPGKAEVQATLTVGNETKPTPEAAVIEMAAERLPKPAASLAVKAYWEKEGTEDTRPVILEIPASAKGKEWDFFPYSDKAYEVDGAVEKVGVDAAGFRFRKLIKKSGDKWPEQLAGLVVGGEKSDKPGVGYETKVSISATAVPALALPTTPSVKADDLPAAPKQPLILMLGLAFLGGLILNIMPCVLPVIALKILGFVNQSREAPGQVRKLGLIYGVGVLASFLVLAGLVIGVQQAGRAASWGMQFQNTQFLVAITALVVLVALNLFGLFEVTLGGTAMGAAGQLATKHGASGAFFNGVLATALATPCTAPFLGVALGFAYGIKSPPIVLMIFLTVGLGLAAPYVILSWHPAWLKFLPRPGAWMEKFKIAMGFPMLATAIWLFSLAAPNFGKNGAFWLGMMLVLLALAAWIWGEFIQRGSKRKGLAWVLVIGLLGFAYGYILEGQLHWRSPFVPTAKVGETDLQESPDGIPWKAWSAAAVNEARKAGKPVLVDFTADWCATCQVNKKTSIEIESVRAKLKALGAVALLGDYTHEDPLITAELQRYGRAGVPLVLVYPKDTNAPAIVLPEFLTPGIVLEALEKAGK